MKKLIKKTSIFFLLIFYVNTTFADISISPVILEINSKNETRSTTILLENAPNGESKIYEVIPFIWKQNATGEDILEPANNIVINPKTIHLAQGEKRNVRIGFRQKLSEMNLKQEQSWRLLFQEISSPLETTSIGININFSIPLFVSEKPNVASPNLEALIDSASNTLQIKNLNENHIKIMGINLVDKNGAVIESFPQLKYILAQHEAFFKLKQSYKNQKLQAQIKIDQIEIPLLLTIKQ